jgi:putative spermidine/putrescine transport system permease protein
MGLITQPLELLYNEIGVVIGMVHYMVPLAVLTLYGQMSGIDRRLVPAARGLGAGATAAFLRIYLPMSLPGIVAAAILVFVFSLGFYITPALLGGGKTLMAAEYISLMVKETLNWGLGTALASTLMLIVFALIAVLSRVVDLRQIFGSR